MATAINLKDARIEFKTSSEIKNLLQEVANSLGMDLSNFLISTAVQKAKEIQKEENILTLSKKEWKAFHELLDAPKEPSKDLFLLMKLEGFSK
ncbi:MAG: DUF1778 domain-containing protein [Sulfurovum sp.]|nr:DUF1778 domain-containing protein [Sulfurovum sp.]